MKKAWAWKKPSMLWYKNLKICNNHQIFQEYTDSMMEMQTHGCLDKGRKN